ncbi:basic blue protein-like [Asparagus officinalis]|uniref:basic blue protein-like n=1 Tax=Asparagus officinalis TaxID=4686 RepID=UPI00098DFB10|nr:basic blue protein-like [Asparagus officinalis]
MASNTFAFLFSILSFLSFFTKTYVQAREYSVGDNGRWDQGVNYLTWSQKYNFTVGDVLVFIYVKGQHNVYQVTEETYRSCNSSSGVKAIHDSGNDRVTLTEATQYWFICDTKGHCKGGMRFGIIVENSTVAKMPSAPSPDDFMPPAPAGNGAGRGRSWWVLGVLFGLFLVA